MDRIEKLKSIYLEIRNDSKYKSLGEQKYDLVILIGKIYDALDDPEVLSSDMILSKISERGFNRLRRLKEFADDLRTKKIEMILLKDETKQLEFKELWRNKIFGVKKKDTAVDL